MAYDSQSIVPAVKSIGLPFGEYIVVGGGSLAIRGIRETRDLDIIVLPSLFNQLVLQGWVLDPEYNRKWNRLRVKRNDVEIYPDLYLEEKRLFLDVQELIISADVIKGISFQPLRHLLTCKADGKREKDLNDIRLIEEYLKVKI